MSPVSTGGGGSQVQLSMLPFSAGVSATADTTLLYQLTGWVSQLGGRLLVVEEVSGIQSPVSNGIKEPEADETVRKKLLGLKA